MWGGCGMGDCDNRMGAAFQAVQAFIETRIRKAKDMTTVVFHDDQAGVVCHKVEMDINLVRDKVISAPFPGGGGNNFEKVMFL